MLLDSSVFIWWPGLLGCLDWIRAEFLFCQHDCVFILRQIVSYDNHKPLCLSLRRQLSGNLPFSPDQTHAQGLIMWVSLKNMLAICLIYSKQREWFSWYVVYDCNCKTLSPQQRVSFGAFRQISCKWVFFSFFTTKVSDIFQLLPAWVISKIKLAKWKFTIEEEKHVCYQCIIKPWKLSCHLERLRA